MPLVDWPLQQLEQYKPELTAENDFAAFWEKAKRQSSAAPLRATIEQVDYPLKTVSLYNISYEGADGTPIRGWYMVPEGSSTPMPALIRYHGYSGHSGLPHSALPWTNMGIAVLAIDIRGQGGLSPDYARYPAGGMAGWMTLGLTDPEQYYYRQVYIDCLRAIDFIAERQEIDKDRIIVHGNSQGGGLTLAVAGLDERPKLALPLYPYLCHFRRSVEHHSTGPYVEIKNWFRRYDPDHQHEETVYRTLSYFDAMNFAPQVKAKTLMAITLQDTTCPPSTCFAAYNHLTVEKEASIYPDYGHEALGFHELAMMKFVDKHL
ncbi:acetylxylan esterase [Paenibacillus senegalensis]|uniref:acetylxylan esterase n=1 Tax=Paenibacillus senegalensis TaxID=1465766 RepID=UPI00028A281B|nr:alpha/beta fold hydrolase [Paenibacillus senegalensis]